MNSLWAFAQHAYARPGEETALLDLQDTHSQSIPLLLWAAWARCDDDALLHQAAKVARQWDETATEPLRRARRGLKANELGQADARDSLRGAVKAAELESERLLLQALQEMTPATGSATLTNAIEAVVEVWGQPAPHEQLATLAEILVPSLPLPALPGREAQGAANGGMLDGDESALRARLVMARQEHQDLAASIDALGGSRAADQLQIARLKKRKLFLRDQIGKIEDRLTPDIIA